MKKALKIGVAILAVILMVGCGTTEDYVLKCTLQQNDVINHYKISSTYEITTDGKIAKKVKTTEVVTSEEKLILDGFEQTLRQTYDAANEAYGGYTVNIIRGEDNVTSEVEIDYSVINMEQFLEDQPAMKNYTNDQKQLTLAGVKAMYTTMGATCED